MPSRLFEFKCKEGHKSEAFVDTDTWEIYCRTCDEPARRIISPVRCQLEGITGAFPSAYDKWGRNHEEAAKVARKREAEHGDDA